MYSIISYTVNNIFSVHADIHDNIKGKKYCNNTVVIVSLMTIMIC